MLTSSRLPMLIGGLLIWEGVFYTHLVLVCAFFIVDGEMRTTATADHIRSRERDCECSGLELMFHNLKKKVVIKTRSDIVSYLTIQMKKLRFFITFTTVRQKSYRISGALRKHKSESQNLSILLPPCNKLLSQSPEQQQQQRRRRTMSWSENIYI